MNMLLMNILIVASRESTAESLSRELVPSQSIKYISTGNSSSPTLTWISIGEFQTQIPLVHALVELPTVKPFIFLTSWLARKDFPDLYGPAIVTGAIYISSMITYLSEDGHIASTASLLILSLYGILLSPGSSITSI